LILRIANSTKQNPTQNANKKTHNPIIGTGPAGLTTAIQLKRYNLKPILLEKDSIGGLLRNANLVENYPGFPNGISGLKLISLFEKQMRQTGVVVTFDEVTDVDFDGLEFEVTAKRNTYYAPCLIIASGTKPKPFPIEISAQAKERIFSEVWPLLAMKNKHIAIIGAGDAAFDFALNLAKKNAVTILNRSSETSCLPLLWERAQKMPRIRYLAETTVSGVEADETGSRLRVACVRRDSNAAFDCDFVIFAIGREPQMDFLSERVKLQAPALIESGKLYFVGDVHNGPFRQTAIAAGDGLRAAMQIYERTRGSSS